jgi:hypothetical protein
LAALLMSEIARSFIASFIIVSLGSGVPLRSNMSIEADTDATKKSAAFDSSLCRFRKSVVRITTAILARLWPFAEENPCETTV